MAIKKHTAKSKKKIGMGNKKAWANRKISMVKLLSKNPSKWKKLSAKEKTVAMKGMFEVAQKYFCRISERRYSRKQCQELGLAYIRVNGQYRVILPVQAGH